VKRLLVACPSFVADCLETVGEIAIDARERFIKQGGEDLALVPALNADPSFIDTLEQMVEGAMP
jgi:ferrochelatase